MKTWQLTGLAFLCGTVFGAGLLLFIQPGESGSEGAPLLEKPLVDVANGPERALLTARIEEQRSEISRLKAALEEVSVPEENPEPDVRESRRSGFERRMEERMARRIDEMTLALGLSDSQRQQLEDIYRRRSETWQARRSGEEVEAFNFDAELEKILTEEQFAEYLETSQEEIYNQAELMATTQLVRLSQAVELAPGQESLVYDAVHYTAQEMMIARQAGEDYSMRETLDERLGTILTEEQMSAFHESMRGGGPGGGPGGGFFGP